MFPLDSSEFVFWKVLGETGGERSFANCPTLLYIYVVAHPVLEMITLGVSYCMIPHFPLYFQAVVLIVVLACGICV